MNNLGYTTAIVTGASSGIGEEFAKQLCSMGTKVIAVGRNKKRLLEIEQNLPKESMKLFIPFVADLTKTLDIKRLVEKARSEGPIDLLINNAGIGFSQPFEKMNSGQIVSTLQTNLAGPIELTQGILQLHSNKNRLHIAFVTSLAGKIGFGGLSVYSATKFAIEGLCESLRVEYSDKPVDITVVRPGIVDTNFFDRSGMNDFRESVKNSKSFYPASRVARESLQRLKSRPSYITIGNDKYFLKLLPFIPFKWRFTVLDLVNKLQ